MNPWLSSQHDDASYCYSFPKKAWAICPHNNYLFHQAVTLKHNGFIGMFMGITAPQRRCKADPLISLMHFFKTNWLHIDHPLSSASRKSLSLSLQVVAQLKSTCASLSEEQLAKLGVVLFNCQAEVEGRRTYPCTEDMVRSEMYNLFQLRDLETIFFLNCFGSQVVKILEC